MDVLTDGGTDGYWKPPPPSDKLLHKYQKIMQSIFFSLQIDRMFIEMH